MEKEKSVLAKLSGKKHCGHSTEEDHQTFERLSAALVPDDASEEHRMRAVGELLELHWQQFDRAQNAE